MGFFKDSLVHAQTKRTAAIHAKNALKVVNTRGGVDKEILKAEREGFVLVSQIRSTTGKTCLTFRRS